MRLRLLWKILLYSSALLLALIAAMLVYVNHLAQGFVSERITEEFEQGREHILAAETERLDDLQLTARLVASFPQLKALLGTDLATIRDFLLSYQQENKRSELLIVLDPAGRVVARTDTPTPVPLPEAEARWVRPSLAGQPATGVLVTPDGFYNAAAIPVEAGGALFGFVVAGSSIDNEFARALRDVSQNEVVIAGERIYASTLAAGSLPWKSAAEWEAHIGSGSNPRTLDIAGERYAAVATPLTPRSGSRPLVIILKSRDRALAPYRRVQFGLLVLGLLAALAGIAGSAAFARRVTLPVAKLVEGTQQVAAGNFDFRLDVRSRDEIGDLAQSFNTMIRGLRERADMQKFVSRSTVEMIQASLRKDVSAGERVLLTIFFSDMRGFTSLAEQQPPEEVVKILNSCLSLQAEKVEKFHGDIDKYVGDCVVAIFPGDDMALNAIRCAVEIHKALDDLNAARPGEEPIQVGIGIVTGEVILGSIGSRDRLDFTVVGSHVNLCARLCSMAGPREVLLAESTYLLVRDLVAAARLEPLQVKGFSQPVAVYKMSVR